MMIINLSADSSSFQKPHYVHSVSKINFTETSLSDPSLKTKTVGELFLEAPQQECLLADAGCSSSKELLSPDEKDPSVKGTASLPTLRHVSWKRNFMEPPLPPACIKLRPCCIILSDEAALENVNISGSSAMLFVIESYRTCTDVSH